jgi:CRISPR/Cas system-associated exonuclease Cas4 (RecB family)
MFRASAFKLNMFDTCGQQYKFTYIDHLDKEMKQPKPYLTMGAHVHNALHDFYAQLEPEDRTYERLEQLLRKRWRENRQGFSSIDDEKKWGIKALQMLKLYHHRTNVAETPVLLEDYYDAQISEDVKLLGRIDRADKLEDGSLHVIDYKTGKYDEESVGNLQLQLYAIIVSANKKEPVTKASYLYLQTMQWHTIEIAPEDLEESAAIVTEQVAAIKQEKDFLPNPNKYCKSCDFLTICPARERIQVMIDNEEL